MESCGFGLYGNSDQNEIDRFMFKHLYPPVRAVVAERWSDIAAVGDVLVQRGKLNQDEVIQLLGGQKAKCTALNAVVPQDRRETDDVTKDFLIPFRPVP